MKPVRVYFQDLNTYKTFGVQDETVGDLHKLMQEKMEKSDDEARKYGVVEKKPDGGTPSPSSLFSPTFFASFHILPLVESKDGGKEGKKEGLRNKECTFFLFPSLSSSTSPMSPPHYPFPSSLPSSFHTFLTINTERFPDITEKLSSILSNWEKEKKKGKGENDFQFWWKERPFENRVSKRGRSGSRE